MTNKQITSKVQGIFYTKDQSDQVYFLALKRAPHEGGFWQPLTGTVEEGETLHECLLRETKEELGLDPQNIQDYFGPVAVFPWSREGIDYRESVYALKIELNSVIKLSDEHTEYKWVECEEAQMLFKFEEIQKAVELIYERIN